LGAGPLALTTDEAPRIYSRLGAHTDLLTSVEDARIDQGRTQFRRQTLHTEADAADAPAREGDYGADGDTGDGDEDGR
jgi:hypothetical protein